MVLVGFVHFSWILTQTWGLWDSLLSCKRTRYTLMNCGDIIVLIVLTLSELYVVIYDVIL